MISGGLCIDSVPCGLRTPPLGGISEPSLPMREILTGDISDARHGAVRVPLEDRSRLGAAGHAREKATVTGVSIHLARR
jgi:hypothetical protein